MTLIESSNRLFGNGLFWKISQCNSIFLRHFFFSEENSADLKRILTNVHISFWGRFAILIYLYVLFELLHMTVVKDVLKIFLYRFLDALFDPLSFYIDTQTGRSLT